MNNCVGSGNQKFFLQFLVWTFIGSSHAALLATWRGVQCFRGQWDCVRLPMGDIIFLAVSTVLAYFFAFFVVAMMCDQREAAITDVTGIESNPVTLERGAGPMYWVENLRSTPEGFADVCGEPCSLRWLLPAPMRTRYKWSPLDDCDAYDKRDPRAIHHFKWVMQMLENNKPPPAVPLPEGESLAPKLQSKFLAMWEAEAAGSAGGAGSSSSSSSSSTSTSSGGAEAGADTGAVGGAAEAPVPTLRHRKTGSGGGEQQPAK